ncbi:MAG: Methionine biosynthesis protein MetW [Parcubacteria group bacterium ADurb.Bin316]|nr:MAG: Methionine biosynthesis protein MetW [Parcubacteria group bacterium ADurb.Bin316]
MNIFKGKRLENFDYEYYWNSKNQKIKDNLFEREKIIFNWIKDESKVLDAAVGNSFLPVCLKEKKKCEVYVRDVARGVLDQYRSLGIQAEVRNIYDANDDGTDNYDYIVMSEVLEHLAMPEDVIKKMSKISKFLVITIPNSAFYRFRLQLLFGRFLKQWVLHPSEHLRFWSHSDFIDWLEVLDFEVEKCEASNGLDIGPLKLFKYFPNLCGHQICYLVKKR